ncbi:hypothetical protein [Maribacter sp. MAR_2009_72]|uniref:hypothetical protein n=1 Tax=Maribacter sp. MAR_2009_72 TaxID=1250050 RepID=UPI00119AF4AD|nr:hypothetical protein [Maribacter sp. MAR_2009_72]TVZ17244.1 hypothetical protein JM81_3522 [Maribacter sp. MAR_2009_72]
MEQDLREMFKTQHKDERCALKTGHEARFLQKLEKELPIGKKKNRSWLFMAASIVILLGIGLGYTYTNRNVEQPAVVNAEENLPDREFTFGDLSPDLKKVENFYMANINIELSKLQFSTDNKDLIDSYMEQLNNLNMEYKNLNTELKELGPNDQTITALIENLQLRLQLLQKLKKKLNDLKQSKNEQIM